MEYVSLGPSVIVDGLSFEEDEEEDDEDEDEEEKYDGDEVVVFGVDC